MKVLAIPPPTTNWSTILDKDSNTVNLVDTLEPPTIATIGRLGLSNALSNASSSPDNNGPEQAIGAYLATPCVEACARCAVPNASIAKMSHIAAIRLDLPTIEMAMKQGAKVMLMSHRGRPIEGEVSDEFTLQPVADP
jgi:hypothetical protein